MTRCPERASCAQREPVSGFCSKPRKDWPSKTKSTWRRRLRGVVRMGKVWPSSSTSRASSTRAVRQTLIKHSSRVIDSSQKRSHSPEKEVPCSVHSGMDQGGGENRTSFSPGPPVENSSDGRQRYVAPVRESHVGDVGEAEEDRGTHPAREFAGGSTRQ